MRRPAAGTLLAAAIVVASLSVGCTSAAAADLQVGDCLEVGGPPDRPETTKTACGSPESNFRVVGTVATSSDCPTDVDTYYSLRSSFDGSGTTICLDIDWVVGGCMSIDPHHFADPVRVDCANSSATNRQRATQVLLDVANVDQCGSGIGYAYDQREFTVCVEDVT